MKHQYVKNIINTIMMLKNPNSQQTQGETTWPAFAKQFITIIHDTYFLSSKT